MKKTLLILAMAGIAAGTFAAPVKKAIKKEKATTVVSQKEQPAKKAETKKVTPVKKVEVKTTKTTRTKTTKK